MALHTNLPSTIKKDVAALRADGTVDAESSRAPVKWRAGSDMGDAEVTGRATEGGEGPR